jgi:transcription initiation factor TFIIIB Brf1 subunit/transcription initiation factor TFIIB
MVLLQIEDIPECPYGLKHEELTTESGDIVCRNCGIVLDKEIISYRDRAFTENEINKRVHEEPNVVMGFTLNPTFVDVKNGWVNPTQIRRFKQIKRIGDWVSNRGFSDSRIRRLIAKLYKIADTLNMSTITRINAAKILLRVKEGFRGWNIDFCCMAALQYSLYLQHKHEDLRYHLDVLDNGHRTANEKLFRRTMIYLKPYTDTTMIDISVWQKRLDEALSKLDLPPMVGLTIWKQFLHIRKNYSRLSGKSPYGILAALTYNIAKSSKKLANPYRRSEKNISKAFNVCEVSIRNNFKDIQKLNII